MKLSQKYGYVPAEDAIAGSIQAIASNLDNISSKEVLLQIFSMMDLTTLHTQDTEKSVIKLVEKANALKKEYPSYPQPASVCVFPNFAPVVRDHRLDPALGVGEVAQRDDVLRRGGVVDAEPPGSGARHKLAEAEVLRQRHL